MRSELCFETKKFTWPSAATTIMLRALEHIVLLQHGEMGISSKTGQYKMQTAD